MRGRPVRSRFWQYVLVLAWVSADTIGWSTPARYALSLLRLGPLAPCTNGSPSGTSAIGAACRAAAISSFSGQELESCLPVLSARSGAVQGVQPSAASTARASRPSSLPFFAAVAPPSLAAFAGVFWAIWPRLVWR